MSVEVRSRPIDGTPYRRHTIVVDGQIIRSQLSPFDASDVEQIVAAHRAGINAAPLARAEPQGRLATPMTVRSPHDKYCRRCKTMQPKSAFNSVGARLHSWCRTCAKHYRLSYKLIKKDAAHERIERP